MPVSHVCDTRIFKTQTSRTCLSQYSNVVPLLYENFLEPEGNSVEECEEVKSQHGWRQFLLQLALPPQTFQMVVVKILKNISHGGPGPSYCSF
ncbi:hypothetical protein TNIN_221741 [Trichonephila inaurata madagascariensis]|uniref:Uncharacterized protein n=1 Tax=Trichonephila inaurata madagascariensis TaxID=2747483 RepID=A0A8X7CM79_9ARAC|nr:hypothetical protein TNIN_221741 [Trichonephila inaurata madagascariensis]